MRSAVRVSQSVLMLFLVAGVLATSGVWADEGTSSPHLSLEECTALADQYLQAFESAKACIPLADHVPQCTEWVMNDLICGCPGYINPRHKRALQIMEAARQQFTDAGCAAFWDCIASLCPGAWGASCEGEGSQGRCRDCWGW